jgi:hypothetical protein
MAELVTEARAEYWARFKKRWLPLHGRTGTIPAVVEMGRTSWAAMLQRAAVRPSRRASPVRVVDSAGNVVEQWGRP